MTPGEWYDPEREPKGIIKVYPPVWTHPVRIPLDVSRNDDGIVVMRLKKAKRVRAVYMFYAESERQYGMKDFLKDGDSLIPILFDPNVEWDYNMTPINDIPPDAVEIGIYVIEYA